MSTHVPDVFCIRVGRTVVVVASWPSGSAWVVESPVVNALTVTGWSVDCAWARAVYRGSACTVVVFDVLPVPGLGWLVAAWAGTAESTVVPRTSASILAKDLARLRVVVFGLRRSPDTVTPTPPLDERPLSAG